MNFVTNLFLYYLVLVGLNRQYQASVHFSLTSAIDKSQQYQKKFPERQESNLGLLSEKLRCYLCVTQPPNLLLFLIEDSRHSS